MARPRYRITRAFAIACAVLGVVLAVDAVLQGGLLRYRLAGLLLGGLLCVPALVALVFGARGLALLRRLGFALVPAALLVLFLEPLLRIAGVGAVVDSRLAASERYGHVMVPGEGEADANGFRNASVPAGVDAVFVGDSQTYGFGVARGESFPFVYGELAGRGVYSMSLGGYGAVQYRELVLTGLGMQPDLVVIGFYYGNDISDAFLHAHLDCAADLRRQGVHYPSYSAVEALDKPSPNLAVALLEGVEQISRIVGLTAELIRTRMRGVGGVWDDEPGVPRYTGGAIATLFTPEYRRQAVDVEHAEQGAGVREGIRITARCLQDIAAACRQAGARCVFVPIHTKEYCYQQLLRQQGQGMPVLEALHRAEADAAAQVEAAARAASIEIVDPTPALVAALAEDRAMWPHGSDGHLNAAGHAEIAAVLVAALQQR